MSSTPDIVVAGGGIAALEFVLALREAAGDRPHVTVVTPEPELLLRPMLVGEPLGAPAGTTRPLAAARPPPMPVGEPLGALAGTPRPLAAIAAEVGFELVPAAVGAVDAARRRV